MVIGLSGAMIDFRAGRAVRRMSCGKAIHIERLSALTRVVLKHRYAIAADDNGSIGAYMDDAGKYRCEAFRFRVTLNSQIFASLKDVKNWWKIWRKKIE
jgi:hypothetical protein